MRTRSASISYGALDALANRVASALLEARGDRLEPVAILLPKGITQVGAMPGTWSASASASRPRVSSSTRCRPARPA